ncbi:hypothetical protein BpHYR1_013218 [Brachionus plicatilis]|uniref:Uncharacterized protein n=1 Tax=Brachionus plicatilis TaxID=10195 RepID=A0A3M7QUM3_BRAPC|nr:hypothetical protein BpHYR1_013218 [Brachionus plicatilis]
MTKTKTFFKANKVHISFSLFSYFEQGFSMRVWNKCIKSNISQVSLKANSCSLIINLKNHLNIYHSSSFISERFRNHLPYQM